MANRNFNRVQALEKEVKIVYASIVIGASGAVGTVKGLASAVKEATAGQYTITLEDRYDRLLGSSAGIVAATPTNVLAIQVLEDPSTFQDSFKATGSYTIQCLDAAGAAVNPAAGSVLSMIFHVRNSTVSAGND